MKIFPLKAVRADTFKTKISLNLNIEESITVTGGFYTKIKYNSEYFEYRTRALANIYFFRSHCFPFNLPLTFPNCILRTYKYTTSKRDF